MDSLERAFDAQLTLEGAAQDVAKEACASLEDGAPAGRLPNTDRVVSEILATKTTIGLLL